MPPAQPLTSLLTFEAVKQRLVRARRKLREAFE